MAEEPFMPTRCVGCGTKVIIKATQEPDPAYTSRDHVTLKLPIPLCDKCQKLYYESDDTEFQQKITAKIKEIAEELDDDVNGIPKRMEKARDMLKRSLRYQGQEVTDGDVLWEVLDYSIVSERHFLDYVDNDLFEKIEKDHAGCYWLTNAQERWLENNERFADIVERVHRERRSLP